MINIQFRLFYSIFMYLDLDINIQIYDAINTIVLI